MNLRIFDTADDLIHAAARTLLQRINAGARTIALSGGTTPKPLYELLGREKLPDVTWVIVDERYVPIDDPQSNAGMIEKTLHPQQLLRFKTELGDPHKTVDEFEREWRSLQIGHLDIALLGMGDDGHTASLFPDTAALSQIDALVVPNFVPRLDTWRITFTYTLINAARRVMFLVSGSNKASVVAQVIAGGRLPASRVQPADGALLWVLDPEAASQLPQGSTTTE
jgi:6-phosphogluconolactonase